MHSDKHTSGCTHVGIAHNTIGDVTVCNECSVVHLTLSHTTLRLSPDAFRSLSELVTLSQQRLDKAEQSTTAVEAMPMINTPQRLH